MKPKKTTKLKWLKYYSPALVWLAVILVLTGITGRYIPTVEPWTELLNIDKLVHFVIFSVFVVAIMYGSAKQYHAPVKSKLTLYAILIGILFGVNTEILQEYLLTDCSGSI